MLGSNPDVWNQAIEFAKQGLIQVVAVIPGTPHERFTEVGLRVVEWQPPEHAPDPATVNVVQAESQSEWDRNVGALEQVSGPRGVVLNRWDYGRFPANTVALVEVYATDGPVDFGTPSGEVFTRYLTAGAIGVVAVPSCYPNRVPVELAASIYRTLPAGLPGVMGYAGEDPVDPVILEALRDVWARYK